ncbi:molybdopterin-binding protein [Microbulbifer hainanensis]|uniref:molybdopterin-binding protein n=1 Tax=Microbulbifer hainanensis TaxID=2735675 RepID=UPI0018666634|nr:molybdopterin-binding protein [Microbulbifer hainanensis]
MANNKRRHALKMMLALGGGALLSGCDRLSRSDRFVRLLNTAEPLNEKLQRALTGSALAREYTTADISPVFRPNGETDPQNSAYRQLAANQFADYRLEVGGRVQAPQRLTLADIRALPARTQITRHDCVEGWSAIGQWTGARLAALLDLVQPMGDANYVVFRCADLWGRSQEPYYESIDLEEARHPQTLLAYELNGAPLPIANGAPLRLRVERQLGYKMAKYIMAIELVNSFAHIGGGRGGYWEDRGYAWYAGI